jgi:hypothetical protein
MAHLLLVQLFALASHRDEPRSTSQADISDFCSWPISEVAAHLIGVRSVGRSGLDLLTLSSSHFDLRAARKSPRFSGIAAHCEESQDHFCSRMVDAARTPDGVSPKRRRNMRLK